MALRDPGLPGMAGLLGIDPPPPLEAAVDAADGVLTRARLVQVSWSPGRSLTVRYEATVRGGSLHGDRVVVAATGRIPDGALVVEDDEGARVGVWVFPNDPALPGLASALDPTTAERLLVELGGLPGPVSTTVRAYRPTRRAVVEARGSGHRIFLKVVRPTAIGELHTIHRTLSEMLPVPASLGFDDKLGIVALEALPGSTLRQALADPDAPLPEPAAVAAMVIGLPDPGREVASSTLERVPRMVRLIGSIAPELKERLAVLAHELGPEEHPPDTPIHGDYYEAQIMVDGGRIVGMLDVDTYGRGRAADDAATMLGHLSVWGPISPHPDRVAVYGKALLQHWETSFDPEELRRRAGAVALSLATGPFRVQSASWPGDVAERVRIAERWAESARQTHEKTLMPFSE
jgi:hypothetical protein